MSTPETKAKAKAPAKKAKAKPVFGTRHTPIQVFCELKGNGDAYESVNQDLFDAAVSELTATDGEIVEYLDGIDHMNRPEWKVVDSKLYPDTPSVNDKDEEDDDDEEDEERFSDRPSLDRKTYLEIASLKDQHAYWDDDTATPFDAVSLVVFVLIYGFSQYSNDGDANALEDEIVLRALGKIKERFPNPRDYVKFVEPSARALEDEHIEMLVKRLESVGSKDGLWDPIPHLKDGYVSDCDDDENKKRKSSEGDASGSPAKKRKVSKEEH